jgi:5-methylcytosine-specific restriction protein A
MISINQLKLIGLVIIVLVITINTQYYNQLERLYKTLIKIPKSAMLIFSILLALGIKVYNPFKDFSDTDPLSKFDPLDLFNPPQEKRRGKDSEYEQDLDSDSEFSTNKTVERKVSQTTKKLVAAKQKWTCGLCGQLLDETYEVDHIIPLYKGGTNDPSNLMAIDPICHRKKTIADRMNLSMGDYSKLGAT